MEIFVSGAGFKGPVKCTCLAELGDIISGIGTHTKGIIEYDTLFQKTRMIPDGTSNLIQQNIKRRKPPNLKVKVFNSGTDLNNIQLDDRMEMNNLKRGIGIYENATIVLWFRMPIISTGKSSF